MLRTCIAMMSTGGDVVLWLTHDMVFLDSLAK